ncbi:MAG TPA: selenium-binding protein SBP56-related protein [Candidatus Dormibacteraeota bacterium]|nr:selenium-binding protein SBP56-related protein [Candidatus Dormibacteraeota bacterium]
MIRLVKQRSAALIFGGVLLMTVLLLRTGTSWAHQEGEEAVHDRKLTHEKYLFVWAGDQSRSNPDFLAVINFDEHSSHYGGVIHTVPLPGPGATGNEPHHVGLSKDETVLATGGLLSVLKGQPEVFFFDVSDPEETKFISSVNPALSSITDDFEPLSDGGFLVTMMGGRLGHAPGRVVEFNDDLKVAGEFPANPPPDGFNPHGIAIRPELNLMVTSDFICPTSTLNSVAGGLDLRGSIRIWDLERREILRTVDIPNAGGTIDVKLIPHDPKGRAYTAGMLDDKLYLVDTREGKATPVFNFSSIAKGGWPQLMRITRDGQRLFITMNQAGKIVMFDTSEPSSPRVLSILDLGPTAGPHYLRLTRNESRLVISDYFLNEDSFGKVHAEGDHKIHVAKVTRNHLVLDPRFQLDFNTAFKTGPARPHGLAMK